MFFSFGSYLFHGGISVPQLPPIYFSASPSLPLVSCLLVVQKKSIFLSCFSALYCLVQNNEMWIKDMKTLTLIQWYASLT